MILLTALLLARLEAYTPQQNRKHITALQAKRPFVHVPYGQDAPSDVKTLACDGRVPKATLDLSHWTDNTTPQDLYADTSTEIALNLARSSEYGEYDTATVVNNHFDVDGVLSAWAATDPEEALPHFQLLCDAAACGDFGEWPSDEGVKLCYAVAELEDPSADDGGYASALKKLPDVVRNLDAYEDLWGPGFAGVCDDYDDMSDGLAQPLLIPVSSHPPQTSQRLGEIVGGHIPECSGCSQKLRERPQNIFQFPRDLCSLGVPFLH